MPKPAPKPTSTTAPEDEYSSAMRIVGGLSWGTLLALTFGSVMILIPQVPRPWLWAVPGLWVGLSLLGIGVQWSVARGTCPKCGHHPITVPKVGKRCPECRAYLKAVNRRIIRL